MSRIEVDRDSWVQGSFCHLSSGPYLASKRAAKLIDSPKNVQKALRARRSGWGHPCVYTEEVRAAFGRWQLKG